MAKYEISTIAFRNIKHVRFYGADEDNYEASLVVDVSEDGKSAYVCALNGRSFYEHIAIVCKEVFKDLGIESIEFHMTRSHSVAFRRLTKSYFVTEVVREELKANRTLVMMRARLK